MSRVIKASQIIGEYKLDDVDPEQLRQERSEQKPHSDNADSDSEAGATKGQPPAGTESEDIEGKQVLEEARTRAEEIVETARNKAEEIREQAREEGYQQGYEQGQQDGYQQGIKQVEQSLEALDTLVDEFKSRMQQHEQELPGEIIDLATQVAGRIVNAEISLNPEVVNDIIGDIIGDISDNHQQLKIKVNPSLIEHIEQTEFAANLSEKQLEFVGDPSLARGDCVVETEFGGKDASVDNKLELLQDQLYQEAGIHG